MMTAPELNRPALAEIFVAFAMASFSPAMAQTANNVKCKGCVGNKDLAKKAIRANHIRDDTVTTKKS